MNQPSLRQFSYLTALEEHKSFSRAAQHCHVTQSTLSAGIREIETILGRTLVDRSRKRIALTPYGEEIAERARIILTQVDDMMQRARTGAGPMAGPVRLGVIPTIAPYFLPRILPGLRKKFPQMELQLFEDLSARLVEKLQQGQMDILLMAFPYDMPGLKTLTLFHEDFMLACPKSMQPPGKSIAPADLKDMNLLLLEDGHCLRDHALSACKYTPPHQRKTFSATSLPTLIQMVQHGYGTTLLPGMVAQEARHNRNLRIIPFKNPAPSREIGMAWHGAGPRAADMQALARTIRELQKS
jgi:LysR family hydrogen peroxide-inducible transcriptional activator